MVNPTPTDSPPGGSSGIPNSAPSTHTALVRRGEYGTLSGATAWLMTTAARQDVPSSIANELDFCMSELLANIIDYAFDDDDPHDVRISWKRNAGTVSLTLEDEGRTFDPIAGDTYVEPETLDAAGHRGYGVHLVRRFADEMHYRREAGRNCVTVVKRLVNGW
jgi:anti-sigma regulatory factor (Ser/Thr protein kinase)